MSAPSFAVPASPILPGRPAAIRLRDVSSLSLTRAKLRGSGWERLSQGLHAPSAPDRSLTELTALVAAVLPRGSGFGHLTSAAVRGWWLPVRLTPRDLTRQVLFATTWSEVHVQRQGMYVRRSRYAHVEEVGGVPCMSAPETLIELARDLSLIDLVPMIDCALRAGADEDDIRSAARPRRPGAATLIAAVDLADHGSESWWESVLRLQHTVTGLGPVETQAEIRSDAGLLLARADLHLTGTRRFAECDGGEHRTPARHAKDLRREKSMSRLQLERFGYTTGEIATQPEMIIRDAEDARGMAHDERRLHTWWRLARPSTLTGHGQTRLRSRLARYRRAANRS
jgi:hypothetical protein